MLRLPFYITLLLVAGLLAAPPGKAQVLPSLAGQDALCNEALLDQAALHYDLGRFDETIDTLLPCLPGRLRPGEPHFRRRDFATRAHRLLALSYLAQRQPEAARLWIERLMTLDRGYRTDPEEDPLYFQRMVDELRPPRWYQKRWVQVGGALVVGGAIGYFAFRPSPEALPHPGEVFTPPPN